MATTKKPTGIYDRKARAALVALGDLIEELPGTVKVGRVPDRITAFKERVDELRPKETKNVRRQRNR